MHSDITYYFYFGKKFLLITTAFTFALTIVNPENTIILRPMVLFFFVLGLAVWQYKIDHDTLKNHGGVLTVFLAVIGTVKVILYFSVAVHGFEISVYLANLSDVAIRLIATLWFWWATGKIYETRAKPFIIKCEPFIFIVFCSHMIFFKIMSIIGNGIVGGYHGHWYVLYYFMQPILAMLVGYGIYTAGTRLSPTLLAILNGKDARSSA